MKKTDNIENIRNKLLYIFRFGGSCTAIKFNPSNISVDESRKNSSSIVSLLNEELWQNGIDIYPTTYNNGGSGFIVFTTTDNKLRLMQLLEKFKISKSSKNKYTVQLRNIVNLSEEENHEDLYDTSYILSVYDHYKINSQNNFTFPLNEEANISEDVEICERAISNQFQKFGINADSSDTEWLSIANEFGKKFANNTKKFIVPGLLIIALFYTSKFIWQKYKETQRLLKEKEENFKTAIQHVEDGHHFEPAHPYAPYEPSDCYSVIIDNHASHTPSHHQHHTNQNNSRLSSLLRTLEDSDVKTTKASNIESKILSLLAETTTTH